MEDQQEHEPGEPVKVTCPQCRTVYRYDEVRFGGAARRKLKCPRCGDIFDVRNPSAESLDSTGSAPGAPGTAAPAARRTQEPEAPELPDLPPLSRDFRYSLAVLTGPDAGSVHTITRPRIYLGRGSSMDVQVRDAEVSRRHAMLEIRDDEGTLTDLGSTNGTWFAGERIDQVRLTHQSEFTLGSTTLMFLVTSLGDHGV